MIVEIVAIDQRCPFKVFGIIYLAHIRDFRHFLFLVKPFTALGVTTGSFAHIDMRHKPLFLGHPFSAFDITGFAYIGN